MPHRCSVPLRARLRAFGFGSSADLVSDHLVAQRRAMLVDQRSARGAVAHPVHEFAEASSGLTGQRVTGMPQVVKVNAGQPGRLKAYLRRARPDGQARLREQSEQSRAARDR